MTAAVSRVPVDLPGSGLRLSADRWAAEGEQETKGVVLLLHGGGQTRHSWRRTGERLARDGWVAYAMDLRGHGDSDWAPDGAYGMTPMLADLRSVVTHLRSVESGPLALVGASLGGKVALIAVGEDEQLADSLVLVDIAVSIEPTGARRVRDFMQSAPNGFGSLEEAAEAVAAYNPHRRHSGNVEGLRKNLRMRGGRWHWHWDPATLRMDERDHDGTESPVSEAIYVRSKAAARRVACPVLLVRGVQSDVVSEAGVDEMRELIPHTVVVDVRDAGHMVAGDDNDIFTASLLGYLDDSLTTTRSQR